MNTPREGTTAQVKDHNGRLRAGGYARISSDPRDRRAGVERQEEDIRALCEIQNWDLVEMFPDNDRNASGDERPQWDRLIGKIIAGEIDAIAAWDQDRTWRLMHTLEDLRHQLAKAKRRPRLATTGQGEIDLFSPAGVLQVQIKTAVSEHEISMMKVRLNRAARQKAEKGLPQWNRAFGYLPKVRVIGEDDDGIREIDPVTGPLVKAAYESIIAGGSITDVARLWNDLEHFGGKGQPWTAPTVSLFLRAARNGGLRSHKDRLYKATWPGLVSAATWHEAQAVLNAPGRAPGRKTVRKHRLTGALWCGKQGCKGYLKGIQTPSKSITYACGTCRGVAVLARFVDPWVTSTIGGWLARPEAVDLVQKKLSVEDMAEITADQNRLNSKLGSIALMFTNDTMTQEQAEVATADVRAQLAKLEARQRDQEKLRVLDGIPLGTEDAIEAVAELSDDRFRAVLNLVGKVTVMPTGKGSHVFDERRMRVTWH